MKKILFIIGSLREGSFNRKLAQEAGHMILNEEQTALLKSQADAFIGFIRA